jgi:hypothetical protein
MNWVYGLKYKKLKASKVLPEFDWYEIAEIYEDNCYTATPLVISAESPEEVIELLEQITLDLKNNLKIVEVKENNE